MQIVILFTTMAAYLLRRSRKYARICEVGIGYGFRASAPFVLALNNQRYLLVRSRAGVGHEVMSHCIGEPFDLSWL